MTQSPILIVEDSADDYELILLALESLHLPHPIVRLKNGADAVDYLLRRGRWAQRSDVETPALVLLDLMLPKLSGMEVLEQVKADPSARSIPIVVLTSSDERKDLDRCYRAGANSYVRKPVEADEFQRVASQVGLYWTRVNERSGDPV